MLEEGGHNTPAPKASRYCVVGHGREGITVPGGVIVEEGDGSEQLRREEVKSVKKGR